MEQKFNFQNLPIRVKNYAGDELLWFAGIDVCNILGYARPANIIKDILDDDEKKLDHVLDESGQTRKTWMINEPGLYHLVINSTKPEAIAFRRHVTHVILPSIRKAGKYTTKEEEKIDSFRLELVNKVYDTQVKLDAASTLYYDLKRTLKREQNELNEFVKNPRLPDPKLPFPEFEKK